MNLIVYDFPKRENDEFAQGIINRTGEEWVILGLQKKENEFIFVLKIFLNRNKYNKIVFWQQRHGIYYANLCNIFCVNQGPQIFLMTFIYKKDRGIKGVLKRLLYRGTVKCNQVTKIICYSKYELAYYNSVFKAKEGKIVSTLFGLADQKYRNGVPSNKVEDFILDVGRSNRDHKFFEDAVLGTQYRAIIADRTYEGTGNTNCIVRKDIRYGEDLYSLIEKSFAVIVPLIDENISAGQTVFIQAMMFGKPIIVTSSHTIDEYVKGGENGFVICKKRDELIDVIDRLKNDKELYCTISNNSREMFERNFSFAAFGKRIGAIVADVNEKA